MTQRWVTQALDDLVELHDNKRIPLSKRERADRGGPYPYYGAQGIIDHLDDYIFDGRYVLVAEDGENLNSRKLPISQIVEGKFWVNNHAHVFRARPGVADDDFLQAAVEIHPLNGLITGAAQPKLSQANLKRMEIVSPPIGDQRRIGTVLRSLAGLIENNRRRIEILEEMARLIYREWFVHFRFPGHEDVDQVDSELGPIPAGWEWQPASEAFVINPRERIDKNEERPFVTMGDLPEWSMICAPSERKTGSGGARFRNGDTLFARITPCLENGKTGFVSFLEDDQVARGSTEFIVLRGDAVGPEFTYLTAREEDFRANAIASMTGASGRQRVRNECFDSYFVPVPTDDVVADFRSLVKPMFDLAFNLNDQNRVLAEARDLLLPRLISGELDVSELDLDLGDLDELGDLDSELDAAV